MCFYFSTLLKVVLIICVQSNNNSSKYEALRAEQDGLYDETHSSGGNESSDARNDIVGSEEIDDGA